MNKPETAAVLDLLKFLPNAPDMGNREIATGLLAVFHAVLGDLPVDMVKAATIQYLSEANPFFPTPGVLRDKAMDLQLLAAGLPTAGEAWGMVLNAVVPTAQFCEEGARLREAVDPCNYWVTLAEYSRHVDNCPNCNTGGLGEDYRHPAVAETVRLLGGRDAIMTDNPTADRARFIEAYREIVSREKRKMGMVPAVAEYTAQLGAGRQVRQLTEPTAAQLLARKMSGMPPLIDRRSGEVLE